MLSENTSDHFAAGLAELKTFYKVNGEAIARTAHSPSKQLLSTLEYMAMRSNRVAWHERRRFQPKTELGEVALKFAAIQNNNNVALRNPACMNAEPRFLFMLNALEKGLPPREDGVQAVIYVDRDGSPFAFRKSVGDPTTLILRQAKVLPGAPVGTILNSAEVWDSWRPTLGTGKRESRRKTTNDGLKISEITQRRAICISRPSTFSFSRKFMESVGYTPSVSRDSLKPFVRAVAQTSLDQIVDQVDRIVAETHIK